LESRFVNRFRQLVTDKHPSLIARGLRLGLRTLGLPYALVTSGRNLAYRSGWLTVHNARLPVVSIGNLSVGGTGKSPMVAWVAQWFRQRDVRVAILSRGYGQLDSGQNDEALELELRLPDVPHLQHWDRVASATLAREELEMQALVLDDGFQHRRLARDLDIVLIDATDPPSARHVLPGGLLREPLTGLRRAHVAVLTRSDQVTATELQAARASIQRIAPGLPVLEAMHRPAELRLHPEESRPLDGLRGTKVLAFCGIGNPESFLNTLVTLGAEVIDSRIFADHHPYAAEDMRQLEEWTRQHAEAEAVVCTLKDWVKLQVRRVGRVELMALTVALEFRGCTDPLERALERVLESTRHRDVPESGRLERC
jgi:tetraacyldisaccharide 4'-kinase